MIVFFWIFIPKFLVHQIECFLLLIYCTLDLQLFRQSNFRCTCNEDKYIVGGRIRVEPKY